MTLNPRLHRPNAAPGPRPRRGAVLVLFFLVVLPPFLVPFAAAAPGQAPPGEQQLSDPAPLASRSLLLDAVTGGKQVIAVGDRGHVLLSDDGGRLWVQVLVPTRSMLTGVASPDGKHVWAVGHDQVILHSADGGRTWVRQFYAPEEEVPILDVWFENPRRGLAVGAYGLLLETTDGGQTWTRRLFDEEEGHGNGLLQAPDGTLYIPAEFGKVFRSRDNGATWEALQTPYRGSFFGGLALPDGALLVFGLRGNVYRSTDGGDAWQKIPTDTTASLLGATRLSDGTLVIVGLSGAVLVSRDGGRSFRSANRPDRQALSTLVPAGTPGELILLGEAGATRDTEILK
jgi:photosystem II stability/assembly factor-like uncharacterized protein